MSLKKTGKDEAPATVGAYLASLTPEGRRHLRKLGEAIRSAAPGAEVPAFRLEGRMLVWYAAWTRHVSLYPINPAFARAHGIDIGGYETAKGTIRFPMAEPVPSPLVKRLVKARSAELRKMAKARNRTAVKKH